MLQINNFKEFSMCLCVENTKRSIFKELKTEFLEKESSEINSIISRYYLFSQISFKKLNKIADVIINSIFLSVNYNTTTSNVDYMSEVLDTYALHISYLLNNVFSQNESQIFTFSYSIFSALRGSLVLKRLNYLNKAEETPERVIASDVYYELCYACTYLEQQIRTLNFAMFNFESEEVEEAEEADDYEEFDF